MSSVEFRIHIAEECHAKDLAALYTEGYGGRYPLKEFTNPELIKRAIQQEKVTWMIAEVDNTIIGSAVGTKADWNRSFEYGRHIIYPPEFRRNYISQVLVNKVISSCLNSGYDLGWFSMRDIIGVKFSEKNGFGLVGLIPGMHKVNMRENHLLYIAREGGYRTMRVKNESIQNVYTNIMNQVETELARVSYL